MQAMGKDIDIQANGATICYDDYGKGVIPLIFIHGFPFNKSMWQPQIDFFKSSHRVIVYDIRGFGKSGISKEKASIAVFAEDLIRLMDALEIKKAVVCGLSMGGYVLLNAVNRYQKRFEAIVLCDTQCVADSPQIKTKRKETIRDIELNGLNDFAMGFLKNIFCKESLSSKKELIEEIKNIILSTSPETIVKTLTALADRWDMCTSLNEISVPTLILCGKEDTLTPPEQSEFLFKNILNSKLHIIDGAGHLSNLEQAGEFNKHLNSFLSDLGKIHGHIYENTLSR
jgi:3-oxoadipate enol-lactonase